MNFKSKQKVHRFKDVMAFFENLSFKKFRQIEHGEKKRGSEKSICYSDAFLFIVCH